MSIALEISNLFKKYDNYIAVNNISLNIKEGEILGLLGPNGAGKTTTLSCIEGILNFDSGSIKIFNEDIGSSKNNHLIGVQLQSSSLPDNITVYEAINLFCKWKGIPCRTDLLDTFDLNSKYKTYYSGLSTGLKRRLHLAIALAHNPKLLILDEPTAGLDIEGRVSLHNKIKELKKSGITIILASHDMAEVEALCDKVAIILNGELITTGTPSELTANNSTNRKLLVKTLNNSLNESSNFVYNSILEESNGYITLLTNDITYGLKEIINYIEACNDSILDLKIENLSLEEKFIEILKEKRGE